MLVKRRVDEELEKRKDEIELEVTRRVEAAKQQMEQEMMAELERRREKAREDERKREVGLTNERPKGCHKHFHNANTSVIRPVTTHFIHFPWTNFPVSINYSANIVIPICTRKSSHHSFISLFCVILRGLHNSLFY